MFPLSYLNYMYLREPVISYMYVISYVSSLLSRWPVGCPSANIVKRHCWRIRLAIVRVCGLLLFGIGTTRPDSLR